jgi:patatin-like phospholipase/acyl hydrolase
MMNQFRILSLDGGGVKGTFTAAVLAALETMTGKRIPEYFDLIVGTSTGGIIAVALGLGIPARQILDFYVTKGPEIFPSTGVHRRVYSFLRHLFTPKHSQQVLKDAIDTVFGDRKLGESLCRLVVTSYDATRGDVHLFKTAHHERFKQDYLLPAAEVAMATAAAPTYFPAFTGTKGLTCIDGGIWANCPATVGLIEALSVLGKRPEDIEILSIGTTSEPFSVSKLRRKKGGILLWNKGLIDLFMQAQVAAALAQAKVITGRKVLRIDVITRPGRFSMDDARQIEELKALGIGEARQHEDEIHRRFFDTPVEPFVPCRYLPCATPNVYQTSAEDHGRKAVGECQKIRASLPLKCHGREPVGIYSGHGKQP